MGLLVVTRREKQSIRIGDNVTVTVGCIGKRRVRLVIYAPRETRVRRSEIPSVPPRGESGKKGNRDFETSILVITRRPQQSIQIGDDVTVTIASVGSESFGAERTQLAIEAPAETIIMRTEILDRKASEQPPKQKATA